MFALIPRGIILDAPSTWSTMMTTNDLPCCVEPYLDSFEQSFAATNYTPWTLRNYRTRVRCRGRLMDVEGVEPAALTPDLADRLAREAQISSNGAIRFHHLARRFAQHLIDLGVASPPPLTEAQVARAALFTDYEAHLIKQRGLSPRTIYRCASLPRPPFRGRADRPARDHRGGCGGVRPAPADAQATVPRQDAGDASAHLLPVSVSNAGSSPPTWRSACPR